MASELQSSQQMAAFEARLNQALERVRVVLDAEKATSFARHVHHQYQDKYRLAEQMTNMAIASQLNCLSLLGLTAEAVEQLRQWSASRPVALLFHAEERCTYDREESREEPQRPADGDRELSQDGATRSSRTHKLVAMITEHFWKYEASYELLVVCGGAELSIISHTGMEELKTPTKSPPHPCSFPFEVEVNVTWLFQQLAAPGAAAGSPVVPGFRVCRAHADCHTPRRNPEVAAAVEHFNNLLDWADSVDSWLCKLLRTQPDPARRQELSAACDAATASVLVPILPLLSHRGSTAGGASGCQSSADGSGDEAAPAGAEPGVPPPPPPTSSRGCAALAALLPAAAAAPLAAGAPPPPPQVVGSGAMNRLLAEEQRDLERHREGLARSFPGGTAVASVAEASLIMVMRHCMKVCQHWDDAMDYIEGLLRKQLVAAIGKEVGPADFGEYMRFHNRGLFAEAFAPSPFCFVVRRSEKHSPEGTLSIEEVVEAPETGAGGDGMSVPIVAMCSQSTRQHAMMLPLHASANVSFRGQRFLHAWLSHKFSGQPSPRISLVAKAWQFSSMLVLIGSITSSTTFEPKSAALVQNRDELTIPLDLSTIPTLKEFRDAIESLSPAQQEFARAFRGMQLASTPLGVLVIHIKPQLERVLNLQHDALTKEIKLTQDLLELFIKYQIPSDLLSYDGGRAADDAPTRERLDVVRGRVEAMKRMIKNTKREELQLRREARGARAPPPHRHGMWLVDDTPIGALMLKKMGWACADSAAPDLPAAWRPVVAGSAAPPAAHQVAVGDTEERDYTRLPFELDERFAEFDTESAVRPTTISLGTAPWTKRVHKGLLANAVSTRLCKKEKKCEKDAAFGLLDALTKSGALPVDHASLHILLAATHCFDRTVMNSVVQENTNPIEKVERSTLILATTVHRQPAEALVRASQLQRLRRTAPRLFPTGLVVE